MENIQPTTQKSENPPEQHKEPDQQEEQVEDPEFKPPLKLKVLVAYLYFVQGVILALPGSMTLIYLQLPQTWILSIFSASSLPFSFKFITAPFIEKFSSLKYGKRKTWVIFSQIMTSVMIFIGSFITSENQEVGLAIIFLVACFFTTLQDISLDALAIKELRVPYMTAMLQGIMQTIGIVLGGLLFLKMTSKQFAKQIGLSNAITSPQIFLMVTSLVILIPTIIIHFKYKERLLESEKKVRDESLLKIISYYKIFFQRKTKYCRALLFFLTYLQGFVMYQAYYEYQLVKNHNFQRNTINTITNIVLIPITGIAIFVSPRLNKFGWVRSMMTCLISKWIIWLLVLIFFPTSVPLVSIIYFFTQLIATLRFILTSILINEFPVMGLSGMFITMLNSAANFGRFDSLYVYLTGLWGWHTIAIIGLVMQAGTIFMFPKMQKWISEGTLDVGDLTAPQPSQEPTLDQQGKKKVEIELDTEREKEIPMIEMKEKEKEEYQKYEDEKD